MCAVTRKGLQADASEVALSMPLKGNGSRNEASRLRLTGRYWPTDQQELLLRAALLEEPEAIQAWRAIRGPS